MTTRLIGAALVAALSLAACGGGEKPASSDASRQAANRKAMLDFASCMRENGVDMPDPKFDGNGGAFQTMGGPGRKAPDKETLRAAEQACKKYQDKVKAPKLTPEQKAEFRKAALANAKCMRDHGIDLPDPVFGDDGSVSINLKRSGIKPDDPKFQAAQKACAKFLPRPGNQG